jgi:hypothetical protein
LAIIFYGHWACRDAPDGAKIPTLSAADLLDTLDERELTSGIESVSAWLRHLVILTPELESASTENSRAATLQRLADMAGALNNGPLARQLAAQRWKAIGYRARYRTPSCAAIPCPMDRKIEKLSKLRTAQRGTALGHHPQR